MEFAELIKISRIDNVRLRRPAKPPGEVTLAITGHHMILSFTDANQDPKTANRPINGREVWLLHRNIYSVSREAEGSSSRSGTICMRYKDLRVFYLDIIGPDKLQAAALSLELLSSVCEPTSCYPFFYNPGFKALEDGWLLFRPEEEYPQILKGAEQMWRLTKVNMEFGVAPTYGKLLPVPSTISDSQVSNCGRYRVGGRFPLLAYLHKVEDSTFLPLVRASHTVAGWRNMDDEKLMSAVLGSNRKGFILTLISEKAGTAKTMEYDISYPHWRRVIHRLASLTELADSLQSIAAACNEPTSDKWLSRLATARWLSHVKDVLNAACLVAQCLEKDKAPVMVLESTSSDLTLVITSLAQIILNPDSRTIHGFQALIEREWLEGGHPFWTRNNPLTVSANNAWAGEQAPVFLLFLDCVYQIHSQFPCSFQFTEKLLVLLADHSQASNFGTFLCNCDKERQELSVKEHTVSLWSYLNQVEIISSHLNCLYLPNKSVMWPSVAPMSINLWTSYFLRWVQDQSPATWEKKKMTEIIEKNKEIKAKAVKLRKELQELRDEALSLGLIKSMEDDCLDEAVDEVGVVDGEEEDIEDAAVNPVEQVSPSAAEQTD